MRGKLRNILGIILILFGISLIGATIWMKYDTNRKQAEMLESFKNINFDDESNINTNDNSGEIKKHEKSHHIINGKGFAILEIPTLDLKVGIVQGVEIKDIKYNVGHFPESAMPGEKGNFAIAGHRVSYFGEPFKEIDKLEKGDKVYVTYNGHKYTYEVEYMYEVTPNQTESLKQTEDATITIVTCTIGAKKRVIVKGKLVE
ncbi:class D sortase [Clostridium sp.]|uniref:class D sortase n=1 Tax=Clostridium sp. TaxID=1506 RepID=UPI002632F328|nr:class D sortase [Clostridium sp.]